MSEYPEIRMTLRAWSDYQFRPERKIQVDIPRDEWDDMSLDEKEEYLEELLQDFRDEEVSYHWEEVGDQE